MTGDTKFINFMHKDHGHFTYDDNNQDKILVEEIVGNNFIIIIENVMLVKGLRKCLLRVNQLCDKGFSITFDTISRMIEHKDDNGV